MRPHDGRVVPTFVGQALAASRSPSTATAARRAASATCDDLVDGIYRAAAESDFHEPVNIGNPNEVTILEFAEE